MHLPNIPLGKLFTLAPFVILKLNLIVRPGGHKQRKSIDMFIHIVCLCPPGHTIKLNVNIYKKDHGDSRNRSFHGSGPDCLKNA